MILNITYNLNLIHNINQAFTSLNYSTDLIKWVNAPKIAQIN